MSIVVNKGGELIEDRAKRSVLSGRVGAPPVGLQDVAQETTVIEVSVDKLWSTRRRYLYKFKGTKHFVYQFRAIPRLKRDSKRDRQA